MKIFCFDERGTVVASKCTDTGTIIQLSVDGDIRLNKQFYPEVDRNQNPDFPHLLRKHRNKLYWKGYGLNPVQKMIKLQLEGKI